MWPFILRRTARTVGPGAGGGIGRATAASLLPFSDDFTRSDGDLGNGWEYTAGKWTLATNKAVGTPGLGADLIVNGAFAADTDWNKGTGWTIGAGVAASDGTAGTTADLAQTVAPLTVGGWFQGTWDVIAHTSGGGFSMRMGASSSLYKTGVASYILCHRATSTGLALRSTTSEIGSLDNVVVKRITLADMFATQGFSAANIDVRAGVTVDADTTLGLALALDSVASPANFLLAVIIRDGAGNKAGVIRCLAGTYTNLIAPASIVYTAGKVLRAVKNGADVSLYYDGVQVGATTALTAGADDALINGTRHGLFASKGGTCNLDAFFCDTAA